MMRRSPWLLALVVPALASLTLVSGCAVELLVTPLYGGVYDLQRVDGFDVPAIVFESSAAGGSRRVEVSYGTLRLRDDNTFSLDYELSEWTNGVASRSTHGYSGTYHLRESDLFLYFVDPFTDRDRTLSGFVRDGYAEVEIDGVVDGQVLQFGFKR